MRAFYEIQSSSCFLTFFGSKQRVWETLASAKKFNKCAELYEPMQNVCKRHLNETRQDLSRGQSTINFQGEPYKIGLLSFLPFSTINQKILSHLAKFYAKTRS